MHYYEVIPKVILGADRDRLTYHSDTKLQIGQLVEVSVGKKQATAFVTQSVSKPAFQTKAISKLHDDLVLPNHLISTVCWMSDYYATPAATILQAILPTGLSKTRRCKSYNIALETAKETPLPLNEYQRKALNDVKSTTSDTVLIHGITGSGKTNVYIKLAQDVLADNKSAIILVPEIALTSQLVQKFSEHFHNVILIHSKQTEAERHVVWKQILCSKEPLVVVGPRSAIFAPVKDLGLIVIDEAHEPSYKQEQSPKYNTLRLASFLANKYHFKAVFGTATPLITDYHLAHRTPGAIVSIDQPAIKERQPAKTTVVNLTTKTNFTQHRFLSNQLIQAVNCSLQSDKQVLIFHNRRGSSNLTICGDCGWQALCDHCFTPLTLHNDSYKLVCHICGKNYNVSTSCPDCGNTDIVHKGIGTKLIETEMAKLWPKASIGRFDGDTPKELALNNVFKDVQSGKIQILVGTQVLAKGLDLPNLDTVGIVQADANLYIPDFSSEERVFQLLSQVMGRVSRNKNQSRVIIQTYRPDSEVIKFGIAQDYQGFYDFMINKRKKDGFPPFSYLLKLTCVYKTEAAAIRNAQSMSASIKKLNLDVEILGPAPAFHERIRDTYRWQLIIRSKKRAHLLEIARKIRQPHWQIDIDPSSLL